eukprot:866519_1
MNDLKAWCESLHFDPIVFAQLTELGIQSKNDFHHLKSIQELVNKLCLTRKEVTRFMIAVHVLLKRIPATVRMIDYKYSGWNMIASSHCVDVSDEIADLLIARSGIIAVRPCSEARFMDTREDEQSRGISLLGRRIRSRFNCNDDEKTIGLSVGGAKDVNTFRECINKGRMPPMNSITYNGLLYEYYFDTENRKNTSINITDGGSDLFYPSYCYAKINTMDFLNKNTQNIGRYEYYMTVGLNSNIKESDFKRKHLNLVIVLDKSGSMTSSFSNDSTCKSKMQSAINATLSIFNHLTSKDRLGIVAFDSASKVIQKLDCINHINMIELRKKVSNIRASGGTNFENGYMEAIRLYNVDSDRSTRAEYENRLMFLTDAHPNQGDTNPKSIFKLVDKYSNNKPNYIYTTFIGVGLSFNASLIQTISNTRGCNYYSVKSTQEFNQLMNEEFEFMVTPLVFDVRLKIKCEGNACAIEKVYGSSAENEAEIIKNGDVTTIKTLFPSKRSEAKGGTKGGIQLIKLKKINNSNLNVEIEVAFEDKFGKIYKNKQYVTFDSHDNTADNDMIENDNTDDYFDNIGIRKGILLCNYVEVLSDWIKNEWKTNSVADVLRVNEGYKQVFKKFMCHFQKEMKHCEDEELEKELNILKKLIAS